MTERGVDKRKWNPTISPITVLESVAMETGLEVNDLTGKSRRADIVEARDRAVYILRDGLRASLNTIGEIMGGRDHSTIITSLHRIRRQVEDASNLTEDLLEIVSSLHQKVQPESRSSLK